MTVRTVHLYVLDTMADWETGYAIAGINQPAYQADPGSWQVRTVGPTRDPVRTLGGVTIVPDLALDELKPQASAMLILPGGTAWTEGAPSLAPQVAREFIDAGVPVAAICGATWGIAAAGLLDDRAHTSNAPEFLANAPGYGGAERYVAAPAHRDGDLITASGTAPVQFAHRIFERLGVYAPPVLEAWLQLYTTGDASAFYALQAGDVAT